ncbi:MAG TPA: DNA methyltransferase [Ktedonobacteraceae bacterium]|nr:DNA methyltransferase [Ktedonobacteraceae bacterium]
MLQRTNHETNVPFVEQNGASAQADIVLTDTDGKEVAVEVKSKKLPIATKRLCACEPSHINCLTAKEWIKCQLGVWQFTYEGRDIRDKTKHPATFPISLARRCIELFSHEGELVVDPFMGSGTTLVAARDANRNAVGFDIHPDYIALTQERLQQDSLFAETQQLPVLDDARNIARHLEEESITCIVTSPPYANLLNRERLNKSRRGVERKNEQYKKVEQYSQRPEDLGTLDLEAYGKAMAEIFAGLLPLIKKKGHCVINVPDMWWDNKRVTIHIAVIEALRSVGYELRNTIIWDRTNIVNNIGIFGWPSNYITMGTTFEYLLDFWRPESKASSLGTDNSLHEDTMASEPHMDKAEDENTAKLNGKARSKRTKKKVATESILTNHIDLQ